MSKIANHPNSNIIVLNFKLIVLTSHPIIKPQTTEFNTIKSQKTFEKWNNSAKLNNGNENIFHINGNEVSGESAIDHPTNSIIKWDRLTITTITLFMVFIPDPLMEWLRKVPREHHSDSHLFPFEVSANNYQHQKEIS